MLVNVIDLSSIIKITQFEGDYQDGQITPRTVITHKNYNSTDTRLQLELYRLLSDRSFRDADANIFMMGNYLTCNIDTIENNISKAAVKKDLKELSETDKDMKKLLFVQEDDISRNNLNVLSLMCRTEILKMIKYLIRRLNLKNPVVTDYSHLRYLNVSQYTVVSIEHEFVKIINVDNGEITSIDTSQGAMVPLLNLMTSSNKESEIFDMNIHDFLKDEKLQTNLNAMQNSINTLAKNNLILTTGGGSNTQFIKENKGTTVKPLSDYTRELLTIELPEPLYNYINSSILLAFAYIKGYDLPNMLSSVSNNHNIDTCDKLWGISKAIASVSVIALVASLMTVNIHRNMYAMDMYSISPIDVYKSTLSLLPINTAKIELNLKESKIAEQEQGLNDLLTQVNEKFMLLSEDLSKANVEGKKLSSLLSSIELHTTANCYSMEQDSATNLGKKVFMFRGTIADVSKVESIMHEYYKTVDYEIERLDDFNSFSIVVFKFIVSE